MGIGLHLKQFRLKREVGNKYYVTNGTYTFTGLTANRQYMGRLTYLAAGAWKVVDLYVKT
jgi:hypothetical protein